MNTTATTALRTLRATGNALLIAARFLYDNRQDILDTIAAGIFVFEAGIRWAWARRHHVRDAALLTVLATLAAAGWVYRAGQWTRQLVHILSQRACVLLPQQPAPALAPITATLQATREALELLVRRLYPQTACAVAGTQQHR